MTLFHIKFPASGRILTWDELGCLCRSLGFPSDLFKKNFPSDSNEFRYDDKGIEVKTLLRMFELGSLYRTLHRTYNMHTADWNTKVIRRAMDMLEHKVLDFDGIYNARVAFTTYEHSDMKGMVVNKRLLLRTLKLCGRVISPLKLLHRIKHVRGQLEEKGRIQLYEFFNLILWCDWYPVFDSEEVESASGMNDYLFRLVDFRRLLSHHDERTFNRLDARYLREERNFGREAPGPRSMLADPIVDTGHRIGQAKYHKEKYRRLKQEVVESEKRVHCAHAGSVRDRPISAPDLNRYKLTKAETDGQRSDSKIRKRIQSAPSRGLPADSERPHIVESKWSPAPRVVTPRDLSDVETKMEELNFDISTLDCKLQLQLEAEMDFFIPGYKDKLPKQKQEEAVLPEAKQKPRLWTAERIKDLTYPPVALPPTHAKTCDARFRGWDDVNTQPGHHVVLDTRTHEHSEKRRLLSKLERRTMTPVLHVHPGYIVRYNKRANSVRSNQLRKHPYKSDVEPKGLDHDTCVSDGQNEGFPGEKVIDEHENVSSKTYTEMSESQMVSLICGSKHIDSTSDGRQLPKEVNDGQVDPTLAQLVPVPHMEHSGPKMVNVGHIGTISLLENIQEAAEFEDRFATCSTINHHVADASLSDTQRTLMADVHKLNALDATDAHARPRGQNTSNLINHRNCESQPSKQEKSPHGKLRAFCSAPVRRNDQIPTSLCLLGEQLNVNEKRSIHTSRETLTKVVPRNRIERWSHSKAKNPDASRARGISGTNKAGKMNTSKNETIDPNGLQKRYAGNSSAEQTTDVIDCLREEISLSERLDRRSGNDLDTVRRFVQIHDAPADFRNLNCEKSPEETRHVGQLKPNNLTCPKDAEETKMTRQKARSRLIGRIQNPNYRLYGNRNGLIYAV